MSGEESAALQSYTEEPYFLPFLRPSIQTRDHLHWEVLKFNFQERKEANKLKKKKKDLVKNRKHKNGKSQGWISRLGRPLAK